MSAERRSIPAAQPFMSGNEAKYVADCLETGWISSIGRYVSEFESVFAEFCGVRHAATCNNGTSALHLALLAMGVEAGDEVLVPTLTYIATANAVRYCGANPVFVDSEPTTMNLDPADIEHRITPRTRGIIAVHLYGHPAAMSQINAVARRHGLWVIEDAAEAHGARCDGRRTGALADVATFSFFGNKIVTTGEGGMVTTDDDEIDARVRLLRGQGMDTEHRYWFPVVGFNYRMTNIQAALGLAQLEMIDTQLTRRREIGEWYDEDLRRLGAAVTLPPHEPWADPVNWLYTVRLNSGGEAERDALMAALASTGVETRPVFYPVHTMPPYGGSNGEYPVAEDLAARGVSLPTHAALTRDDVAYVAEHLAGHLEDD
jgi:perosamine synthetase